MKFSFTTPRLQVRNWRADSTEIDDLAIAVKAITTPTVMKDLPDDWQHLDSSAKVIQWILDREKESYCLGVYLVDQTHMIGIVLLSKANENPAEEADKIELRLGYLINESYWGQGYASEIIKGLCDYCQTSSPVASLIGGVDPANIGSIKVLTKNGFCNVSEHTEGVQFYLKQLNN